jgi:Lon protease-like protein
MEDVLTKDVVELTPISPLAATTTREVERIATTIATLIMVAETIVEKTEDMIKGTTTRA